MTSPHTPPADPSPVGHETSDVKARGLLWLAAGIFVLTSVAQGGLWLLVNHYRGEAERNDPPVSPLAAQRQPSSGPRLQDSPNPDYEAFRDKQKKKLDSYAWIDKQQGVVRIPVSRAIELLVERGLPTPEGPTEQVRQP
jgi:hypothetical protein